jgi:type I restriction enzyme S subunit
MPKGRSNGDGFSGWLEDARGVEAGSMTAAFVTVPAHQDWPMRRARFLFSVRRGRAEPGDQQLAATQSHGVLSQRRYVELTGNNVVAALAGTESFIHVDRDDFVISLRTFEGGIERASEGGCISPAYTAMKPSRSVDPNYFQHLLKSEIFVSRLQTTVTGIREGKSVKFENFADIVLPVPDLATQKRIADFLDTETTRIGALIEKKQRLLTTLHLKRSVDISHAVTKGIRHGAAMRASGVQWLGEIPESWALTKLGYLGRCANGINIDGEAFGTGYPFISYGDVYKNRELPKHGSGLVQSSVADRKTYSVKAGDVFFTRTSETIEEVGFSSVCTEAIENAVFAGFLIRFRPYSNRIYSKFSKYAFQHSGLRDYFASEMNLITRASLSQDLLRNMPVPLPPMQDQEMIANHLEKLDARINEISDRIKIGIILLVEKRAALITAAVTGQIDVSTHARSGSAQRQLDHISEEADA